VESTRSRKLDGARRVYLGFLDWVVYPNFWVAAAIASLAYYVQAKLELGFDWRPIAMVFAAALIPYNLDRVVDARVQAIPGRAQAYFQNNAGVLLLLAGAASAFAVLFATASPPVRQLCAVGIVPLLYGLPLFPWQRRSGWRWYRLKDIPGIKAWIVCTVLTYAAVALPLGYAGAAFDERAAFVTVFLFAFIGSNSHSFDIRDIASDRAKGVLTLPVLLGNRGTRIVLTLLNLTMLLAIAWGWQQGIAVAIAPLATVPTLVYVWTLTPNTPRSVYDVAIDGLLFLPALSYVLLPV